ncbi:MAG: LytTR family DNA-binding domain-containing protein [Bacteroidota bacterium]
MRSIKNARVFLKENPSPDLIFSDIELLDGNVFNLFQEVTLPCPVIFCTAYNRFYAEAFQSNGISYVLKPYQAEDIREAWEKYQRLFSESVEPNPSDNLLEVLKQIQQASPSSYKSTLMVKKRDGIYILKTEQIAYIQAKGDFSLAIDQTGGSHMLQESLGQLSEVLPPNNFFRINRSELINFTAILKYEPYTKNRLAIHLASPPQILYTSNTQGPAFKNWLENH